MTHRMISWLQGEDEARFQLLAQSTIDAAEKFLLSVDDVMDDTGARTGGCNGIEGTPDNEITIDWVYPGVGVSIWIMYKDIMVQKHWKDADGRRHHGPIEESTPELARQAVIDFWAKVKELKAAKAAQTSADLQAKSNPQ